MLSVDAIIERMIENVEGLPPGAELLALLDGLDAGRADRGTPVGVPPGPWPSAYGVTYALPGPSIS